MPDAIEYVVTATIRAHFSSMQAAHVGKLDCLGDLAELSRNLSAAGTVAIDARVFTLEPEAEDESK